MDLYDLLESWLLSLKAERKSPATLKTYGAGVVAYLEWCAKNDRPQVLDRRQVSAWISALLERGAEPATARSRQLAVRRFSAWLLAEEETDADPLLGMKPPRLDEKLIEPLTEEQLTLLLKACQGRELRDRRDEAVLRLMIETGLRAGEVVAIGTDDVDLGAGIATVRRGKGGRGRTVSFGAKTAASIDRYLRMRRTHKRADSPALWLGERGQAFGYSALWKILQERAAKAGLGPVNPHRLRHTAASRWLTAGGSEGGLMAQAGWTKREMLDRYSRATASARAAEEAKRLDLGDL